MNAAAIVRAKAILAELRELLPDHVGAIDALATKLEAAARRHCGSDKGSKDQLGADS